MSYKKLVLAIPLLIVSLIYAQPLDYSTENPFWFMIEKEDSDKPGFNLTNPRWYNPTSSYTTGGYRLSETIVSNWFSDQWENSTRDFYTYDNFVQHWLLVRKPVKNIKPLSLE